jgi:hypothetical protein
LCNPSSKGFRRRLSSEFYGNDGDDLGCFGCRKGQMGCIWPDRALDNAGLSSLTMETVNAHGTSIVARCSLPSLHILSRLDANCIAVQHEIATPISLSSLVSRLSMESTLVHNPNFKIWRYYPDWEHPVGLSWKQCHWPRAARKLLRIPHI